MVLERAHGVAHASRGEQRVAVGGEVVGEERPGRGIVLDDQDGDGIGSCRLVGPRRRGLAPLPRASGRSARLARLMRLLPLAATLALLLLAPTAGALRGLLPSTAGTCGAPRSTAAASSKPRRSPTVSGHGRASRAGRQRPRDRRQPRRTADLARSTPSRSGPGRRDRPPGDPAGQRVLDPSRVRPSPSTSTRVGPRAVYGYSNTTGFVPDPGVRARRLRDAGRQGLARSRPSDRRR